ncbi:eukaryotic-like serine/threonine-protein kinase [Frankia sp. AiPs1]|uniref:serine/threonine-protein kinase n=1 Tax=Frankia sp. AiPa1 TaxID=573492 RepID=UPI00202B6802|nr:serine/threonine-protein kinase [Frankia sp. AiPa1]MCL9762158.1 serine/threonine protein kinase [Frankia sp. AiPa1]
MEPLAPSDPETVGGYRLVARLGTGGMGRVYLAQSPTGERVAFKVIRPDLLEGEEIRQRFADEIDALQFVHGSRNARFEAAGVDSDPPWLAFEYVPGRTLRQHVAADGPLDAAATATLGVTLTDALDKIHRARLLHRDLKPQNIILGPDGPKVIDFGLAVLEGRVGHLTASGFIVGTPAYLPPEQANGNRQLTAATDVYALGATLVYASTGHTLYPALPAAALITAIVDTNTAPDLSSVPGELTELLAAMVALDPAARPGVMEVQQRLVTVAESGGPMHQMRRLLEERTYVAPSHSSLPPETAAALADEASPAVDENIGPAVAVGVVREPPRREPAEPEPAEPEPAEPELDRRGAEQTVIISPPQMPPTDLLLPVGTAGGVRAAPTSSRPRGSRPLNVGWLADELRAAYARDAPL